MITNQPTKKQLTTLTRVAKNYAEESSYLMLDDGTALAALYRGDRTHHAIVRRDGSIKVGGFLRLALRRPA